MNRFFYGRWPLIVLLFATAFSFRAAAQLATCWHIPDNTSDLGFNMRNPETAIGASTAVKFYTGVWKFNGAVQRCNQTGGTLYYKTTAQNLWSSTNLSFYLDNAGNGNQYWQTALPGGIFSGGDTVQYFFKLAFDGTGSTGATNTWLYGTVSPPLKIPPGSAVCQYWLPLPALSE